MNSLTKCLYDFAWAKHMSSLYADEEYMEVLENIEHQRKRVEAYLTGEQQQDLYFLINSLVSQGNIEGEHLFQAALSLSRELRKLW